MEERACRTVPSPSDARDWDVSTIYKKRLARGGGDGGGGGLDLRLQLPPVRDQGSQGTCAAQTAACMKEWQEKRDYGFDGYMSPQFIYNNRENQGGGGMYGRDVMRILSKVGSVEDAVYSYGRVEPVGEIEGHLYERARLHKIKSYARVSAIDDLKTALAVNGPCYIAFPTYNYGPRMWVQETPDAQMTGGHAMTVVGYDAQGFVLRNTWGARWGDGGYCTYPYSDWGAHWEIWTTVDERSYLEDDGATDPGEGGRRDDDRARDRLKGMCKKLGDSLLRMFRTTATR